MKKIFLLLMLVSAKSLIANDTIPETKITHKFGGRIDVMVFSDTYNHIATRNGLQYIAPDKPSYNNKGVDVNFQNRLRMSASPSRFSYTMTANNVMGATVKGFIEVDFMGVSESTLNLIRMRHVYVDMKWKKNGLLIGQTSHLSMPDEVAANTVTYGGGYPMYPLNRPVQVQYKRDLWDNANIAVAAAMFGGAIGSMQSNALIPDIQFKLTSGDPSRHVYGIFGGVKTIKPRTLTTDGDVSKEIFSAFNVGVFGRYIFGQGYAVRLYGILGQDLTALSILGGYAALESEAGFSEYGYAAISGFSTFLDFESPTSKKGWQWGIFGGMQQNLGAVKEIVPSKANVADPGLNNFWRVAPRVFLHSGKHFSFGLEYMLSGAQWAKEMDKFYQPVETYDITTNHRLTFLARFKF